MVKALFTVRVDDYLPDLCALTIPAMERYARKIGASFTVINQRKFPDMPPTYEKMQVWELGKDNDWNILLDCDMAIREEMYDVTQVVPEDSIGSWMVYNPSITIDHDEVLPLDGTALAIATNFLVVPRKYHQAWQPLKIENPLSRMKRPFVVDEYCFSRNVHELGCQIASIALPGANNNLFMHCNYTTDARDPGSIIEEIRNFLT